MSVEAAKPPSVFYHFEAVPVERVWGGSGSSSRGGRGSGCGLAPQHGVGEVLFKMEADEDVTQQRYHLSQRACTERHPATCSNTHTCNRIV